MINKFRNLFNKNETYLRHIVENLKGGLIDTGPAIKFNITQKQYNKLMAHDLKCMSSLTFKATYWHEITHFFQLMGSSYGYLLYKSKRWRHKTFLEIFKEIQNLNDNKKYSIPCLKELVIKFGTEKAVFVDPPISFPLNLPKNPTYNQRIIKLLEFYIIESGLVDFLRNNRRQSLDSYLQAHHSFFLSLIRHERNLLAETDKLKKIDSIPVGILKSDERRKPRSLAESILGIGDISIDLHGGAISPRSIIEGYTQLTVSRMVNYLNPGNEQEIFSEILANQFKSYYSSTLFFLADKIFSNFPKSYRFDLMCCLYELSLMVPWHPALILDLDFTIPSSKYFFEKNITERFLLLVDFVVRNRKYIYAKIKNGGLEEEHIFDTLDDICAHLEWPKYSHAIDRMIDFYEKAIEIEDGFPKEALFYLISKEMLLIKRRKRNIFLSSPFEYLTEFERSNIPLLILFEDGPLIIRKEAFNFTSFSLSEVIRAALEEVLSEITDYEIMNSDNFNGTRDYFRIIRPPSFFHTYLREHPYSGLFYY